MALELFEYLFSDLKEAVWEKGPAFQSWFSGPRILGILGGPPVRLLSLPGFLGLAKVKISATNLDLYST